MWESFWLFHYENSVLAPQNEYILGFAQGLFALMKIFLKKGLLFGIPNKCFLNRQKKCFKSGYWLLGSYQEYWHIDCSSLGRYEQQSALNIFHEHDRAHLLYRIIKPFSSNKHIFFFATKHQTKPRFCA